MLNSGQKKFLLSHARAAIMAQWLNGERPEIPTEEKVVEEPFTQGLFVSLHVHGKLRGCVGSLNPVDNLLDAIWHAAQSAAFQDQRFAPLQPEELLEAKIEISLLYPRQHLHAPEEIEIGKDGVMIRLGEKHGLLLPQVAGRRGWDAHTFLQHLCRKADLAPEDWQNPDAELFRFHAEFFSEE